MRDNAIWMVLVMMLLVGVGGGGSLLSRDDRESAERRALEARVRLLEARLERERVERLTTPPPKVSTTDDVCRQRTEALRGAIKSLILLGKASFWNSPGPEWHDWEARR